MLSQNQIAYFESRHLLNLKRGIFFPTGSRIRLKNDQKVYTVVKYVSMNRLEVEWRGDKKFISAWDVRSFAQ